MRLRRTMAVVLAVALVAAASAAALAQPAKPLPTIAVSAFNPPSLGAFIPPIIKAQGPRQGQRLHAGDGLQAVRHLPGRLRVRPGRGRRQLHVHLRGAARQPGRGDDLPLQHLRLLRGGGDEQPADQDLQGPRRQAARGRHADHGLGHGPVVPPEERRRHEQGPRALAGLARHGRLDPGESRRRRVGLRAHVQRPPARAQRRQAAQRRRRPRAVEAAHGPVGAAAVPRRVGAQGLAREEQGRRRRRSTPPTSRRPSGPPPTRPTRRR